MTEPRLSLIIPAYNEEDRIRKTLDRIREYLKNQNYSYEVLIVIDGATDRTFEIATKFCRDFENFKVVYNRENHGKGYVVRQGMLEARGEYRVFTDTDNSTDISYLEPLLKKFGEGYSVVISSRDSKDAPGAGQEVPQSFLKHQLGNASNLLIQLLAVPGIWDTQNGFKGFTARAAEDIFSRATIDRWGFDFEALAITRRLGYKIGIIPIVWRNDPKSHVKLSSYFKTFLELLRVRWNLWTGRYTKRNTNLQIASE